MRAPHLLYRTSRRNVHDYEDWEEELQRLLSGIAGSADCRCRAARKEPSKSAAFHPGKRAKRIVEHGVLAERFRRGRARRCSMFTAELVDIGKIAAVVAQAAFGVFALTHDWKKDGELTTAGRVAVLGICISALFGAGMIWSESQIKRSDEKAQLTRIENLQAIQNELLTKQADTLKTTQRALFPIKKIRASVLVFFPATSKAYEEECGSWAQTERVNPLTGKVSEQALKRYADGWSKPGAIVNYINPAHFIPGRLLITAPGEKQPKLDVSLPRAVADQTAENRIVEARCVRGRGVVVELVFDETKVNENNGIWSILDLQGKQVSLSLVGQFQEDTGQILSFVINFSEKGDESAQFKVGPSPGEWTPDQLQRVSSGSPSSDDLQRTRKILRQPSPAPGTYIQLMQWSASAHANRDTMKMLAFVGGN